MGKKELTKDDLKILFVLTHILGIFIYVLGSLIIYLVAEDKKLKEHSKKALNWQISFAIYIFAIFLFSLFSIITKILIPNIYFLFPFSFAIWFLGLLNIAFCIVGGIKAYKGIAWEYPLSLNLIKN
jgi:uncharacterized protein